MRRSDSINEYDIVSIVPTVTKNHDEPACKIWANIVGEQTEIRMPKPQVMNYLPPKKKNMKDLSSAPQLDLDSISFVGHSYYNQKGSANIKRKGSLRLRPDEERRKERINEKKEKQRTGISTKKERRMKVVVRG